jgi:ribosome-associated protein
MTENLTLVVNNSSNIARDRVEACSAQTVSTRGLVQQIVQACEEVKGQETTVLDVQSLSDVAEYLVIVSGKSDRQVQGITNRVVEDLIRLNVKPIAVEGYEEGQLITGI